MVEVVVDIGEILVILVDLVVVVEIGHHPLLEELVILHQYLHRKEIQEVQLLIVVLMVLVVAAEVLVPLEILEHLELPTKEWVVREHFIQ
jgi:hypothetical protein